MLKEFADETAVFGLHLFKRRRGIFDTVFWILFVLFFAGYTMKTLITICETYLNEEVTTFVHHSRNQTFSFPAPALCFFTTPSSDAWSHDVRIDDVIDEYSKTGDLSPTNFLFAMHTIENIFTSKFLKNLADLGNSAASGLINKPEAETDLLLSLFAKTPDLRISDFVDFVLIKFCRGLNVSVKKGLSSTSIQPACERGKIDFAMSVNENDICIDLDPSTFVFGGFFDEVLVSFSTNQIRENLHLSVDAAWFSLEMTGYESGLRDFDAQFQIIPRHHRMQYVRLSAVYRNLDLRRRHCDADRRRSLFCVDRCELDAFSDAYGCWPFLNQRVHFDNNASAAFRARRCEADDYLNFTAKLEEGIIDRFRRCRDACLPACENPIFSITGESMKTDEDTTEAGISVISYVYPLVEERLASDFESFLAAFGGGLSLWLGVSFASLVHVPVFVCKKLVGSVWKTKNKMVSRNGNIDSNENDEKGYELQAVEVRP